MATKKPLTTKQTISLDRLEENIGQLPGLPPNPRYCEDGRMAQLKENITKYPMLLDWRSLLLFPLDNGNYIIIGGNQRYKALRDLGHTEAPCYILPPLNSGGKA